MQSHGQPTSGCPLAWRLSEGLTIPHRTEPAYCGNITHSSELEGFFWNDLANGKWI